MLEIERKFLLIGPIPDGFVHYANILQGYFAIEGENQCRIRILKTSHKKWFNDNIKCTLTLKSNTSNKTIRNEYEFPIGLEQALEIIQQCQYVLTKKRYTYRNIIIDDYGYEKFSRIVEVEDSNWIPPYCGEELTSAPFYSAIMAKRMTADIGKKEIIHDFLGTQFI